MSYLKIIKNDYSVLIQKSINGVYVDYKVLSLEASIEFFADSRNVNVGLLISDSNNMRFSVYTTDVKHTQYLSEEELPFYGTSDDLFALLKTFFTRAGIASDVTIVGAVPLPSGASTSANQSVTNNRLESVKLLLDDKFSDYYLAGAPTSAEGDNAFMSVLTTAAFDCFLSTNKTLRHFYTQVVVQNTVIGGKIIFEGSNDNINFTTIINEISVLPGVAYYSAHTPYRYVRCRISSKIDAGTISLFTVFSVSSINPNLNLSKISGVDVLKSNSIDGLSNSLGVSITTNKYILDKASNTHTVDGFTNISNDDFGMSSMSSIIVTAATGIMYVTLQISIDNGISYFDVYTLPPITDIGLYKTPLMMLCGRRRWKYSFVGGATFTFSIHTNSTPFQSNIYCSYYDLDEDVLDVQLNAVTDSYLIENLDFVNVNISSNNADTIGKIMPQYSFDNVVWSDVIEEPLDIAKNENTFYNFTNYAARFVRAKIIQAGVNQTLNYVHFYGKGK